MSHFTKIIEFRCEKCNTKEIRKLTLGQGKPDHPTYGNLSRAVIACNKCGHKQMVNVDQ